MQKKSYSKVNEYIWEKVLNGELKLGDKLPPERELICFGGYWLPLW